MVSLEQPLQKLMKMAVQVPKDRRGQQVRTVLMVQMVLTVLRQQFRLAR
jgi:hypothetical protein